MAGGCFKSIEASLSREDNLQGYNTLYVKPFNAGKVVDPLLSGVILSAWTAVCDDDPRMRELLSN